MTLDLLGCKTVTSNKGVIKMGNTVPRAGLEPTSLACQASVLPLHHIGFPDVTTIPTLICLAAPYLRGQCRLLHYILPSAMWQELVYE